MKKFLCVLLSVLLVLSCVVIAFASSGNYDEKLLKEAAVIAKQIEAEGIVLLKNEDNALPLTENKVNVFGMGSINFALGAGGSGSVSSSNLVDFYTGLENAGIEYNTELYSAYEAWANSHSVDQTGQGLVDMLLDTVNGALAAEMPYSSIDPAVMSNAKGFSDTALLVITRSAGELFDVSTEDIKLTSEEMNLVKNLDNDFGNVIIIFNTCNILQMDWLDDYQNVNAALLVWTPGEVGAESIGEVLTGAVNPSGKLTDTIAYDINDYPTTRNFGNFAYSDSILSYFVNYQEGIYVGYRYFETFAPHKVMYPFGYGLSYTSFDWEVTDFTADSENISVSVKVKNTGERAGKDVVEVYFSAPFYKGGIEKSAIELAGYKKTAMIEPGSSDTVTVTFKAADMASYDYKGEQGWVLDAGNYQIKVGHTVRDFEQIFDYNVASRQVFKNDDKTGKPIQNRFDDCAGDLDYLSRTKNNGISSPSNYSAPDCVKNCDTRPEPTTEGKKQNTGVVYEDGNIMLADVAADESLWDKFLDQFTVSEMIDLIAESGYKTAGLDRLGVPVTVDNDGPAMVKGSGGLLFEDSGLAYPTANCLASTWNDELAEEFGTMIAKEANSIGTNIWYAPACNIHRNPMGGRNCEYYSEDPLLSGKMATAVIKGAQSQGIIVTVKHFVCNDQETNRLMRGVFTWTNEQAMREIYLEPFEYAVKEGEAKGVMTAYNRIGPTWCSGSKPLVTDVLRGEWGFGDGFVVSDAYIDTNGSGYMDPVLAVYARNDALLTSLWYFAEKLQITSNMKSTYENDPIGFGNALRMCVYDLCRIKMQTAAFDPTQVTGHKGMKVKSYEYYNGEAGGSGSTDETTTSASNSGGSSSSSSGGSSAASNEKSPKTAWSQGTKMLVGALTAAGISLAVAVPTGIRIKQRREEESAEEIAEE